MFHVLGKDNNKFVDADLMGTTATHTAAAATTNSGTTAPTVSVDVVMAINTQLANQMTMFNQVAPLVQQMVAFSLGGSRPAWQKTAPFHVPFVPQQGTTFQVPPVQDVHVPMLPTFHSGGFTGGGFSPGGFIHGRGGRSTNRRCTGRGHGDQGCTPFADHMTGHRVNVPFSGGSQFVPQQGGGQQQMNPPHSNITKIYNNWNACYSCGFDIEDGHFLSTCPAHWRKPSHNEVYTHANVQDFLNRDPHVCMKGIHKTMLPTQGARFWQGGAENIAYKFNDLVSAIQFSLYPTQIMNVVVTTNNDDNTIVTSNRSCDKYVVPVSNRRGPSLATAARHMFGMPLHKALNAITIAT
jgi:hypothetical protein